MVTRPDLTPQVAARAVELARRAIEQEPESPIIQNTLGVARYRAGDSLGAIEALTKAEELAPDQNFSFNGFFLAMAHWQLGYKAEARAWYDKADAWMERNAPQNEELIRFRAEAAALLGVHDLPADVFARP